jgi:hypothetical protein
MVVMGNGHDVEEYARRLAAGLGVPDFVYRPARAQKGSGDREVSDGLLVAGSRGLILQVKSREPAVAAVDTLERARLWVAKNAAKALRQADGTRRALRCGGRFTSMRGFERSLPPGDNWPAVVLIDHPRAQGIALGPEPNTVWLTTGDWLNLHYRLRSTAAVIEYVERALASGLDVPLGGEQQRYERLAQADAEYASRPGSQPIIPGGPLSNEDALAVAIFDDLVERVADPTNMPWDDELYLPVVELLDSQPVLLRVEIGHKMLDTWRTVRAEGGTRGFLTSDRQVGDRIAFVYDIGEDDEPDLDQDHVAAIAAYGCIRQIEALETGAAPSTRTLAVGVRHNEQRGRRYAFALFEGSPPPMDLDVRQAVEADHGVYDARRGTIVSW